MLIVALFFAAAYVVLFAVLLTSDKGRRSLMLGLRSLWLHKLRAFLSVLGIIIGTTAVITLMAFGEGSMQDALEDIKRLGATNIIIRSVKPPSDSSTQKNTMVAVYGLKYEDYERMQTIPSVIRLVPMRIFPQEIRNLERRFNGRVVATRPEYTQVNPIALASGRFLTEQDDHDMANVCVLGSSVADAMFPFGDPIGQSIRLGDRTRPASTRLSACCATGCRRGPPAGRAANRPRTSTTTSTFRSRPVRSVSASASSSSRRVPAPASRWS